TFPILEVDPPVRAPCAIAREVQHRGTDDADLPEQVERFGGPARREAEWCGTVLVNVLDHTLEAASLAVELETLHVQGIRAEEQNVRMPLHASSLKSLWEVDRLMTRPSEDSRQELAGPFPERVGTCGHQERRLSDRRVADFRTPRS